MTYPEAIAFLYEQLPAYQRIGKAAFKKDLTNIRALCSLIHHPHKKFRSIHIAGTNGKGSVSHMLASILHEAGYRVGLYTSPHLKDFRERIKVNGKMIPKNSVIHFLNRIEEGIYSIQPSFFEITVAMAFDHFARQKVDIGIVETGLGGRLDSTNILQPELAVITNIGLDHQNMLGETIELIASEKAGIIKQNTPVLIGQKQDITSEVFESAASAAHAPIHYASDIVEFTSNKYINGQRTLKMKRRPDSNRLTLRPDLTASYQVFNCSTASAAVALLNRTGQYKVKDNALKAGLENVIRNTGFAGRWQVIREDPLIILDGAHNEPGIEQAVKQLREEGRKDIRIVYGCVNDKDLDGILNILPDDARYFLTQPPVNRARPAEELATVFLRAGKSVSLVNPNYTESLSSATEDAGIESIILVTGSIFLVGALA